MNENKEEDEWVKDVRPPAGWPKEGEIEFVDYSTRYPEDTRLVLKNLNFKVNGSEKVGGSFFKFFFRNIFLNSHKNLFLSCQQSIGKIKWSVEPGLANPR